MSYLTPSQQRTGTVGSSPSRPGGNVISSSPRSSTYVNGTSANIGGTTTYGGATTNYGGSSPRGSTYIPGGGTGTTYTSGAIGSTTTPYVSGSIKETNLGNTLTASPRGSTYIPQRTSATGGTTINSSPRSSTYVPAGGTTGGTYSGSTGTTYTGSTGTTYQGSTGTTYQGSTGTTYTGAPGRTLTAGNTATTTPGKLSNYIPGTTSGGTSNYVPQATTTYTGGAGGSGDSTRLMNENNRLQGELSKLRNENTNLRNEVNRLAAGSGGHYNQQMGKVVSGAEYTLQRKVEELEKNLKTLRDDKDRLQVVVHDLKRYAPEYKGDEAEDPDLDGSYLNLKHRNVVETLEIGNKQLKKKNKMLMDENELLKTQVRSLCAADESLGDKFMQSEVGKLQQKIRELKTKNNEMEIQLKTYDSDKRHGGPRTKTDIIGFDDGLREENARMKRDMTAAYKKISELESGDHALGRANLDKYKALTNRVNELEKQNQQLLNRMKGGSGGDYDSIKKSMGANDEEKDREIYMLKRENDQLREELMEKNDVIRKLQSGKGGENAEAIQNLISANERLLAQVMQYQERLNQSQSMSMMGQSTVGQSRRGGGGGMGVLKSEFMDPYKESKYTLD